MKMKETKNYHYDGSMIYIPDCRYHIVFSPKYRRNVLIGDIEKILKEFLILKNGMSTLWIHSKFISSVGAVTLDVVKKYIEEQKD